MKPLRLDQPVRLVGADVRPDAIPQGDLSLEEMKNLKALLQDNANGPTDEWIEMRVPRPSVLQRLIAEVERWRYPQ